MPASMRNKEAGLPHNIILLIEIQDEVDVGNEINKRKKYNSDGTTPTEEPDGKSVMLARYII